MAVLCFVDVVYRCYRDQCTHYRNQINVLPVSILYLSMFFLTSMPTMTIDRAFQASNPPPLTLLRPRTPIAYLVARVTAVA